MRQALELALEALELHGQQYPHMVKGYCLDAITAIKQVLAQPEQEPVAHTLNCVCGAVWDIKADGSEEMVHTPNATPPQRKPLTDEQIQKCYETTGHYQTLRPQDKFAVFALARAIEAAHGITGEKK